MNDALAVLKTRRSLPVQALGGGAPDADDLTSMLTIAARVPDHGRLTPWRFVVLDEAARSRIGELMADAFRADQPQASPEQVEVERNRLAHASLVVAVVARPRPHPKIPEWEQTLSAGAVCMNLMNAAAALGYGANWLTGWAAFDRRILDALGLEPSERLAGFVHLGRPTQAPVERPRPDLAALVTRL